MSTQTDAYGNPLPRGTRRQLAKEVGHYRRIGRELSAAADSLDTGREPASPGSMTINPTHDDTSMSGVLRRFLAEYEAYDGQDVDAFIERFAIHHSTDLDDVISVEASERPDYWRLVAWDQDGQAANITGDIRHDEARQMEAVLHAILLGYPSFRVAVAP